MVIGAVDRLKVLCVARIGRHLQAQMCTPMLLVFFHTKDVWKENRVPTPTVIKMNNFSAISSLCV